MTVRVLSLTRYDDVGASSRVRVLQYIPLLAARGIDVQVSPLFGNAALARLYRDGRRSAADLMAAFARRMAAVIRASGADVIWLQQEIFPFLPAALEIALLARRPVVMDFDDAQWLYYQDLRWPPARALYRDKLARLMAAAAAVVVGNPNVGAYARAAGARSVHVVHSAVDTRRFAAIPPVGQSPFAVGWIGTPMTARQSLPVLARPLRQFLEETATPAVFVGMDQQQFPELPGRRVPWSETAEAPFLGEIAVGLCPLEDAPWTRGKSGYKIIQYMSAGRATLASPVGIAADLVEPGVTGLTCATESEWYANLTALHRDAGLCRRMGEEARRRAEARYDIRVAADQLYRVLADAARGVAAPALNEA